jgi:hypothetical protein
MQMRKGFKCHGDEEPRLLQWPIRWQMTTMIVLFLGVLMSKPEKGRTAPNLI